MRIDTRAGSKDYIEPLRRRGVPVEEAILDSGDFEIVGNGPHGPVLVGVEHKKLPDLFQCIRNGRFADQLRKMRESYQVSWLLVEGRMRAHQGKVQIWRKNKWQDQLGVSGLPEVLGYMLTMSQAGGVLLARAEDEAESVEWLRSMNNWWTVKDWEQHRAHMDFYKPEELGGNPLLPPTVVQKVASMLPGVGAARSYAVSKRFSTIKEMVDATVEEWQTVEGIGKKGAEKLYGILRV